ncbi:MAG: hypothetical protein PHY63_01305 [Candidatus Cloacimonetes bacterium]|nr:hypothetical protein [Candidatus Cloacimonadota bacterium]
MIKMNITAKINGIKYTPLFKSNLPVYSEDRLEEALNKSSVFILSNSRGNKIALSTWVSPKRTRSYPYARIYDVLNFQGRRVAIIPIIKDEGQDGDRDFLQWDTISLMSLLGVYTIIAYYSDASKSSKYKNKITKQMFDIYHIRQELKDLSSFQSDAIHWNLNQINKVGEIARRALEFYNMISKKLNVQMHSFDSATKRIEELLKGRNNFMKLSRKLAEKAQHRESVTIQPKEKLSGIKATLSIKNYLGGYYFFTVDEVKIDNNKIYLIESKHSKRNIIPSLNDIKDGLVKMILFTNLKEVTANNKTYNPIPVLKLTSDEEFAFDRLKSTQIDILKTLNLEASENDFQVLINNLDIIEIEK